jgi:hypothetical protein
VVSDLAGLGDVMSPFHIRVIDAQGGAHLSDPANFGILHTKGGTPKDR